MRRSIELLFAAMLILVGSVSASTNVEQITFDPTADSPEPAFQILSVSGDHMSLELEIPTLGFEEFVVENELFHVLTLPGGVIRGADGQAGIPSLSRMVAVPEGATVTARVVGKDEQVLAGYRVFPVQPQESDEFVIDRGFYAGDRSAGELALVEVGAPAYMRHVRMVPVTVNPVSWNAASGELRVANRVQIELSFDGALPREAGEAPAYLPESFHHLFEDTVLGYELADETTVGPGSYLMIYANNATILSNLQPLIEWRKQQGYSVVVVSTATTGTTTTNIKSYIQNAYNTYDPPLEHVVLVGDAAGTYVVNTYNEGVSGYNGEGDHYYTNLEGGDLLPDVHLGRLSVASTAEVATIVDKIVTYETNPPTADAAWFKRAGLAGDPSSSGMTTVYINQWVKQQLLEHNFTQVDTMWAPSANQMRNSINQGMSIFGYRGYWQMSGMTTSYITGLTNGDKLPYAVIVTCDTGTFKSDGTCRSEAFLRAPNGGGIASVGTATTGTHTRYNNCYYAHNLDQVINGGDHGTGVSHTNGKTALWTNYSHEPTYAERFMVWNNLMGDPATDVWTAYPGNLTVSYPSTLPVGANSVAVSVTSGGSVEGARVTLYKDGQIRSIGYTDFTGNVNLPISGYSGGTLQVTVTKHDYFPHRGSLTLGTVSAYASYQDSNVDDDNVGDSSGNSNGVANPGEFIELPVALHNYGTSSASNVVATISTIDPYVTITDGTETFGTIASGATVWSAEDFDFIVAPNTPAGHVIAFDLTASSGVNNWTSLIELTVSSAAFDQEAFVWGGTGATLDPGESGTFSITVRNTGDITGTGISAVLGCESPWVTVSDASGGFGSINSGATGNNAGNPFALSISSDCFEGHLATFTVDYTFNGAYLASETFNVQIGSASTNDPVGPDKYGYYAFDNTDTSYPYAPTYSWVEIDPNYGGSGSDLGLTDFGWEQDDIKTVNLPFDFGYYGQTFDEVSICSNGYIAMGRSDQYPYTNWSLPGAGGASGMIAPMWDNLYQTGTNKVYTRYDAANHRFIVQWSRLRNDYGNSTQNFEVILLDPVFFPTSTGDGEILFQYQAVVNNDARDGYVTTGIQSMDRLDGFTYTYWNDYAAGAATLAAGRAIRILPLPNLILGYLEGDVTNSSNGGTPAEGVTIKIVELNQTLISASDGHYYGSASEGTFTVRAEHDSFDPVQVSGVQIFEDQTTVVDFALTDILGPYIQNTTVLPNTDDNAGPYVVDVNITDFSNIDEMHFYYKLNGGGFYELPLTLIDAGTGHFRSEIPGYPLNTWVQYWIEAEDSGANLSRDPAAAGTYYEFFVVPSFTAIDDDMDNDLGWTVGDVGDNATTGIWVRGEPDGTYSGSEQVQPEEDASADGTFAFVTGNANTDDQGADDVDNGKTTLLSPLFDLTGALSADLSYRRWFTNDTGSNPDADYWVVEVTDDNGGSWVELENTNVSDRSWSLHSFDLGDYIAFTSTVRFRFIASDNANGSIIEAAVDEFMITGFLEGDATAAPDGAAPAQLTLMQNSPNPFNPKTSIRFGLPTAEKVSLQIFDASGRLVRDLLHERQMGAGFHDLTWDGREDSGNQASSGIYFYRLSAGTKRLSAKMTLLK